MNYRMALESLLKPVKWIDEQVLRQHTKVAIYVEDKKGVSKNTLSDILSGIALCIGLVYSVNDLMPNPNETREVVDNAYEGIKASVNLSRIAGVATYLNVVLIGRDFENESSSDSIAVNPITHYAKKISRALRLPGFIAGLSGGGYSLYETFAANGNFSDNLDLLVLSSFVALGASALYMKDADPKLLEKQPFWKKAYNWAKEKVGSLVPEPTPAPQPIPIQLYATLENYVQAQPQ